MSTCPHAAPKFRDNAVTAIQYDGSGLSLWFRNVKRKADGNGLETVKLLDPVYLPWSAVSAPVMEEAQRYGMKVRFERQLAFEKNTSNPYDITQKLAAAQELRDHYASGTESWSLPAGGGGSLSADTRALILAVQRALGVDADAAEEAVRGWSASERADMRLDVEIKPHLDAVYAEMARAARTQGGTEALKEKLKALRVAG